MPTENRQPSRTHPFQQLKVHKHYTYRVDDAGILHWERKQDTIAAETAHDGWYIFHTNLTIARSDAAQVRPVFDRKPERVINHVQICILA